ncbi:hypothetical protein LLG46_10035 [bacterium]|nr:hypothetical protein [bacterium]
MQFAETGGCILVAKMSTINDNKNMSGWIKVDDAVQTCYQKGVPHTDSSGRMLFKYDPSRSFLPIGIYHFVLNDQSSGILGFDYLAASGFNFCHYFEHQQLSDLVDGAVKSGIRLIPHHPTDEDVRTYKDSPAILGWYLDEEATGLYWGKDMESAFNKFLARRDAIKAIDPNHPVFALDACWITPPATDWWIKWNSSGDVTSHDNYPLNGEHTSLSFEMGIPESVGLAVSSVKQSKPMWFCAQAHSFDDPKFRCVFPTPMQERCMIYTALIHGATGIIYFGIDSYVLRGGKCIGVAPNPQPDYSLCDSPERAMADTEQIASSRRLWETIVGLNRELAELRSSILSSTATIPYEVYIQDLPTSAPSSPIRTLLKTDPAGDFTMLLTNVQTEPCNVRVRFPGSQKLTVTELFADSNQISASGDTFEISCPGFDARVLKISLR